jgi:hypothetical protein
MLDTSGYNGNGNKNGVEVSPHSSRTVIIKDTYNNKCLQGCRKKGTLIPRWWESKLVQRLWGAIWRSLKNLKIEVLCGKAISHS